MTATKKTWVIPSESETGKTYTVTKDVDAYSCSCPNWIYRRRQCKHILNVCDGRVDYQPPHKPILLGGVGEVTEREDDILIPLIPLDGNMTDVLATALYDLMCLGVSWGATRKAYNIVPKGWTRQAVIDHVEERGRLIWVRREGFPKGGSYIRVGVVKRPLASPATEQEVMAK